MNSWVSCFISSGKTGIYHFFRPFTWIFTIYHFRPCYLDNTYILVTPYKNILQSHIYIITLHPIRYFWRFSKNSDWFSWFWSLRLLELFFWVQFSLRSNRAHFCVHLSIFHAHSHAAITWVFFPLQSLLWDTLSIHSSKSVSGNFPGHKDVFICHNKALQHFLPAFGLCWLSVSQQFLERLWKSACSRRHSQQAACLQPTCFGDSQLLIIGTGCLVPAGPST